MPVSRDPLPSPMDPAMKEEMTLSLQATWVQLRNLFKLRDEAHGILEDLLNGEVNTGELLCTTSSFFCTYISHPKGKTDKLELVATKDDFPKSTKAEGDRACADILAPMQLKFHMTPAHKQDLAANLEKISGHLDSKYGDMAFQVDLYLVLLETFRFFLLHRENFASPLSLYHDKESIAEEDEEEWIPCVVCGDQSFSSLDYCGINLCGKCKLFFRTMMRHRQNLTLRCTKRSACKDEFGNIDTNCQKCRFDKCKEAGMIIGYFRMEAPYSPVSKCCTICQSRKNALGKLLGMNICNQCLSFFDYALTNRRFLTLQCKDKKNCPVVPPDEDRHCPACLFAQFKRVGLFQLYEIKSQDSLFQVGTAEYQPNRDILYRAGDKCVVCDNQARENSWMGVRCCETCRGFLIVSMRQSNHAIYCCPGGEAGQLCKMEVDRTCCKYCWLRRLEIEGLVDLWLMSGGNPHMWDANKKTTSTPVKEVAQGSEDSDSDNLVIDEEDRILDSITRG